MVGDATAAVTSTAAPGRRRWYRPIAFGLSIHLLAWAVVVFWAIASGAIRREEFGWDARLFAGFGQRFLETGQAYYPVQLAGSYLAEGVVNLYPPITLYLFVPFAYLPLVLWWVIPLGIFGWHVWSCRPAPWTWPILALVLGLIPTVGALVYGGTILWSVAFICIGLRHPIVGALLGFKPTDAVMCVLFVRHRSFWIGVALMGLLAIPFGDLWIQWWTAISNIESGSPLRNVMGVPMLLLPVVAWVGRSHRVAAAGDDRQPGAKPAARLGRLGLERRDRVKAVDVGRLPFMRVSKPPWSTPG